MSAKLRSQPLEHKDQLVGREQPRIFTPPLRELTPETSKGFAAILFAEVVLGLALLPWQRWLLIHALELNPDGSYRFRTVLVLVARQNGKSTVMLVLALWMMYVEGAPLVIGTAQNLDISEELWSTAVQMAESVSELAELIQHVDKTNGKKALRLVSGERYKVAAASRRGGRGLSGDLVLLDELREHQTWDAWSAVTKTTMARRYAQVWAASNAGDVLSIVLRHLQAVAHKLLGWPDGEDGFPSLALSEDAELDESLGLFEWSAKPGRGVWDREGWQEANPALGHTITERAIRAAITSDPEHTVRTEVLCQYVDRASTGPFPTGAWGRCAVETVEPDFTQPVSYGVDMSHDRTWVHVAVAFWDTTGRKRVELAASRVGSDWVVPWLTSPDRRVPVTRVVFQSRGAPISSLTELFTDAGLPVTPWGGRDLPGWHGLFFDLVVPADGVPKFTHGNQPVLDRAANTAVVKALGDGWVVDRRGSVGDVSPLIAAIAAVGGLQVRQEPARVSAYESHGLLVV